MYWPDSGVVIFFELEGRGGGAAKQVAFVTNITQYNGDHLMNPIRSCCGTTPMDANISPSTLIQVNQCNYNAPIFK